MIELTPGAEALRKKLDHLTYQGCHGPIGERVGAVARAIVEELGITEKHVDFLDASWSMALHDDDHDAMEEIRAALSTLLELAGEPPANG